MTISFVAVGALIGGSSLTSITIAEPAGVQAGDMLIACINHQSGTLTPPSGWTQIFYNNPGAPPPANIAMYYRERGASAVSSGERTWTKTTADDFLGSMLAIRSSIGRIAFQRQTNNVPAANASPLTCGTMTTTRANEFLVMFGGSTTGSSFSGQAAATDPVAAGWTERQDGSNGGANINNMIATATKASAGATGQFSVTPSTGMRGGLAVAAFTEDYFLAAEHASYATSAQAAELVGPSDILDADHATYATSAQDAGLFPGRKVIAAFASYITSAQDAVFRYWKLIAERALYATSAQAANLLRGRRVGADNATYSFNGQDINFSRTYILSSDFAQYTTFPQDASLFLTPRWIWTEETGVEGDWIEDGTVLASWSEGSERLNTWVEQTAGGGSWSLQPPPGNTWSESND